MMNQHKNINNKRYFYNEARSQQSGDLRQEGKRTLVGARFVIKVSFIINIFMLIHHFRKNILLGIH
jgi:hypothetical protein